MSIIEIRSLLFKMVKVLVSSLVLAFAGMASSAAESPNEIFFMNISLEEGLSQLTVSKILQDSKGYMWFGTRNGLNRYDGNSMKLYRRIPENMESLADNQILALCEEGDSALWIGNSLGLTRLDLKTDKMNSFRDRQYPELTGGVRAILPESTGTLLVGGLQGLFHISNNQNRLLPASIQGFPNGVHVTSIMRNSRGRLFIGTTGYGLFICDDEMNSAKSLGGINEVSALFEDSRGTIWVASKTEGLCSIDPVSFETEYFNTGNTPLTTNDVRCFEEIDGKLFIGTSDGLYAINLGDKSIYAVANRYTHKGNLSHYSVCDLCADTEGGLWVGTYAGGVNYYNRNLDRFHLYEPLTGIDNMIGIYSHIFPTEDDRRIYIATEGNGVLEFDLSDGNVQAYTYDASNIHSRNTIKSVLREGNIVWLGTSLGSIYSFNLRTHEFSLFCQLPESTSIYSMTRDKAGNLWLATASVRGLGLVRVTKDKQMQSTFFTSEGKKQFKALRLLKFFDDETLLIGGKYDGLMVYDIKTGALEHYGSDEEGPHYLPSNYVTGIDIDSRGYIWLGMLGGGIAMITVGDGVKRWVRASDGLASDDVCMIVTDKHENVWISSSRYICQYNPIENSFSNYNVSRIGVREFTLHCGTMLPDGKLCFSASNGFVLFDPDKLQTNTFIPPVVLTDLYIDNEIVTPSDKGVLNVVLDDAHGIKLKYNQNNLSISYCALNYIYPKLNQYAYRMKGLNSDWNYVGNRTDAYFPSMRPGRYVFEVKASNNDGLWTPEPKSLSIIINPPFWLSWYMKILYVLLFLGLPSYIIYSFIRKRQLMHELALEQESSRRKEELHETALRMYTNLSHELRTPLTLIESPVEEILSEDYIPSDIRSKLGIVRRNAKRLNILVNQIMDFRKTQVGKMKLAVVMNDFSAFVEDICCAFRYVAYSKGIELGFKGTMDCVQAWYDEHLMEKVIFNLLSNAFKYTPDGGRVEVSVSRTEMDGRPYSFLSVSDNGCGIPEDEKRMIFEPFFQSSRSSKTVSGTGIGLSLTLSIVELHKGKIWFEDNEDGGTVFNVIIPISNDAYADDERVPLGSGTHKADVIPSVGNLQLPELERRYLILLAEDDNDVREYVKGSLECYYDVIAVGNGDDALDAVNEKFPDLIVSDIIMPGKNGLELCTEVKDSLETGHIPVILITAKSLAENVIEGLTAGADDYVIKPFNIDVLIHRIHNCLISREKLKKLYGRHLPPDESGVSISSPDDRFTKKFFGIIDDNISNPELSIDLICREIGMCRTNLYRKLKAITYVSPADLIKTKRLEYAARLLRTSNYTIAEIATFSGFNSQAYFSSCFKAEYNCTPSEYLIKFKNRKESSRNSI